MGGSIQGVKFMFFGKLLYSRDAPERDFYYPAPAGAPAIFFKAPAGAPGRIVGPKLVIF